MLSVIEINYFQEQNSWLQVSGLDEQQWFARYIESFYWSASTIMLIGAKGQTILEVGFTTTILLITVGVFAYLLSTISTILEEINKEFQQYKRDLGAMNRYMSQKNLGEEIQIKVRSFIEYLYQASSEMNTKTAVELVTRQENSPNYVIVQMEQNQFIGQNEFIGGIQSQLSARCQSYVTTCSIQRSDFLNILKENQDDFQKFCMIKDQILQDQFSCFLQQECKICGSFRHQESNCNLLNYRPNKGTVYLRSQYSTNILERTKQLRGRYKTQSIDNDLLYYLLQVSLKLEEDEQFNIYCAQLSDCSDDEEEQYEEDEDDEDYDYDECSEQQSQDCKKLTINSINQNFQQISGSLSSSDDISVSDSECKSGIKKGTKMSKNTSKDGDSYISRNNSKPINKDISTEIQAHRNAHQQFKKQDPNSQLSIEYNLPSNQNCDDLFNVNPSHPHFQLQTHNLQMKGQSASNNQFYKQENNVAYNDTQQKKRNSSEIQNSSFQAYSKPEIGCIELDIHSHQNVQSSTIISNHSSQRTHKTKKKKQKNSKFELNTKLELMKIQKQSQGRIITSQYKMKPKDAQQKRISSDLNNPICSTQDYSQSKLQMYKQNIPPSIQEEDLNSVQNEQSNEVEKKNLKKTKTFIKFLTKTPLNQRNHQEIISFIELKRRPFNTVFLKTQQNINLVVKQRNKRLSHSQRSDFRKSVDEGQQGFLQQMCQQSLRLNVNQQQEIISMISNQVNDQSLQKQSDNQKLQNMINAKPCGNKNLERQVTFKKNQVFQRQKSRNSSTIIANNNDINQPYTQEMLFKMQKKITDKIKQMLNQNELEWFFYQFEQSQAWKIYYPQYNLNNLVDKYNRYNEKIKQDQSPNMNQKKRKARNQQKGLSILMFDKLGGSPQMSSKRYFN